MKMIDETHITKHLNSSSRNKLIIHSEKISDLTYLDVGKSVALELNDAGSDAIIPLRIKDFLDKLFSSHIFPHDSYGSVLAIMNVAILLEPELKLDFRQIVDNFSLNNGLFVLWNGEIHKNGLHFLDGKREVTIELNNLSHIVL